MNKQKLDIFKDWDLKNTELNEIVNTNPSLRGFLFGYVGEYKLRHFLSLDKSITELIKYDNHDRKKKSDIVIMYKGVPIAIEVKSLQTNTIKENKEGTFIARFQCDASDSRNVTLPTGEVLKTTCLVVDEFDLLAVNIFGFCNKWVFAFAKNRDLPRSKYRGYNAIQRQYLLATLMKITWPLKPPFRDEPFNLLDELIEEKKGK